MCFNRLETRGKCFLTYLFVHQHNNNLTKVAIHLSVKSTAKDTKSVKEENNIHPNYYFNQLQNKTARFVCWIKRIQFLVAKVLFTQVSSYTAHNLTEHQMEDISPWTALPLLEKILSSGSLGLKHPPQLKAHPSAKLFFLVCLCWSQSNSHGKAKFSINQMIMKREVYNQ